MLDMMKMMGKFKEAQEKMKKIKDELDTIEVSADSGAGLVKVVVNGKKELISVEIDESILNEKDMVQDLVVAASNKALKEIDINPGRYSGQCSNLTLITENSQKMSF